MPPRRSPPSPAPLGAAAPPAPPPLSIPSSPGTPTAMVKRWLPLEANPDVMNQVPMPPLHFLYSPVSRPSLPSSSLADGPSRYGAQFVWGLGVPEDVGFCDVYGLDDEMLAMVRQPVLAVLLLYPQHKKKESDASTTPSMVETKGRLNCNDSANYRERRLYKMENHGKDHEDALKDVEFREQPACVDLSELAETADTEKAAYQMQYFVKHWEYRRANNARLRNEELGRLSQQREDIEQKKQQIMEEDQRHNALKCSRQEINDPSHDEDLEEDAEHDSTPYWKRRDVELRYRYIFNHFPTLADEDVIGKTDHEILSGEGIDEKNKVKREVMDKGIPIKREFLFSTPLFGPKTCVVYIEPIFSKIGETIGVNYVALDITDQVKTREKMADIRVREAVQKAKETEHSRSPNITEDTPQAKQIGPKYSGDLLPESYQSSLSVDALPADRESRVFCGSTRSADMAEPPQAGVAPGERR
ncbi:hypothetical protein ZWY2020_025076 [Hordeum vulgare]|nr:hypothetical protein ZWY2020_025076 [Hordeum vulgare]